MQDRGTAHAGYIVHFIHPRPAFPYHPDENDVTSITETSSDTASYGAAHKIQDFRYSSYSLTSYATFDMLSSFFSCLTSTGPLANIPTVVIPLLPTLEVVIQIECVQY